MSDNNQSKKHIIFIHGLAATGKYTIAGLVHKRLESTGVKFFHNHLVIDAVKSLFDFGSESFVQMRHKLWMQLFERAIKEPSLRGIIFTLCFEFTTGTLIQELEQLAKDNNTEIHYIHLVCDREKRIARCSNPDRQSTGKLCDPDLYNFVLDKNMMFEGSVESVLTIDTALNSVEESAAQMCDYINQKGLFL